MELMPSLQCHEEHRGLFVSLQAPSNNAIAISPPRQQRVAAYLAKADISPQHSVHSRLWQREVVIQESREGFIVHQEIPQRQTCREMVFCFRLIRNANRKKKICQHHGASGENHHNTDCLVLNRWTATGFWHKHTEQRGSGAWP